MLQLSIAVGDIDGNEVSIRRSVDGSLIVRITDNISVAEYQRTQQGLLLLKSNYRAEKNDSLYRSLMMNLKEIDRRSIEMSEAELRVDYKRVCNIEGYSIQVGQSNSLMIFITVEKSGMRALMQYTTKTVSFISSTFSKEENSKVRQIVSSSMLRIVNCMRKYNMITNTKDKAPHLYSTDSNNFETGMTEAGLRERARVDRQIANIFNTLENSGYSNLEIQALLMESVLETAMQSRLAAKQNAKEANVKKQEDPPTQFMQGASVKNMATCNEVRRVIPRNKIS